MSVRILIDSTADLPREFRDRMMVVPLTIHFGQEEFLDGVNITGTQFYEKLVESDVLPTTSQATPYDFQQYFEKAVEAGDQVVAILISHKLSGTYQSACIAAADYPDQVYVIDSHSVALGSGILAQYALELADKGLTASEIADVITEKRDEVRLIALLDTLEYLKKGGRISKTAAVAGSLLSIKPVVEVRDGEILVLGKARGSRQGNNMLVQQIEKAGGVDFKKPLLLGYTGLNDSLLQKYVQDSAALWKDQREVLPQALVGSVVGTYAGPGAVAVAFFAGNQA